MLPGYVAGWYSFEECHIDLAVLAEFAGARLIVASAYGVNHQARCPAASASFTFCQLGLSQR